MSVPNSARETSGMEASSSGADPGGDGGSAGRRWWQRRRVVVAGSALGGVGLVLAAALPFLLRLHGKAHRREGSRGGNARGRSPTAAESSRADRDSDGVRIPLGEVIRFKERQWFAEELEASREGDANAMLRIAKMYLHGQGCGKDAATAQEWLRKARLHGVYGTLEELYAGDDWQEEKARAAAVARRNEKQRMLAMGGYGGGGAQAPPRALGPSPRA
ncbi:hypothetical protein FOA52_012874 [Chlamydomonas sp. UWO 241]|nr:hypothetical protein FOA52_012874 [Chlamydomonas sp. UWO 241]